MNKVKAKTIPVNPLEKDWIIFKKNQGIFMGMITKVTEKAVKVDYTWESIMHRGLTVFNYTTYIPKSVLVQDDENVFSVVSWFAHNGLKPENIYHIKKYYIDDKGEVKFV